MKTIFCTASYGGEKEAAGFKHVFTKLGCSVAASDTASMLKADGLFIYLKGSEHGRVKEDLNMMLNKGIPVAYCIDGDAVIDDGLRMQLGLAKRIEGGSDKPENIVTDATIGQLKQWISELESRGRKRTKRRMSVILCAIAAAAVLGAAAYFMPGGLKERLDKTGAGQNEAVYPGIEDISEAISLDLSGKGISDIGFLKSAVKLEELDLSNNDISDIEVLSGLVSLKVLKLSGNRISDITPIAGLHNLEELDLSYNDIDYINQLLTLKKLKKLDIRGNKIDDVAAFEFMENVEILQ